MSYAPGPNPYESPSAPAAAPSATPPTFKPISKLAYLRMYQYVFENPNWMTNVLLGALCSLIPIVGPLVMVGYQFEIISALLATQGGRYPDFNFNSFAAYLMRGVWPFLVQLVASFVLTPILLVVLFVPMAILIGIGDAAGKDAQPFIFGIGFPVLALIWIPLMVVMSAVLLPAMLRAGLAQDFVEGFNFAWIMDFLRKTWFDTCLALLFIMFTAGMLAVLGMLACYVGLFLVMPVIFLAQAHLYYQLYLLYLSRGGSPVLEKTSPYAPQR